MDITEAKKLVINTFTRPFDEAVFKLFIRNLLQDIDVSKEQVFSGAYIKDAFKPHIKTYKRIGTYTSPDGEILDVLIVKLTDSRKLEYARTMQRNFVADYLKTRGEKDAALVAFYNDNSKDWRFSFVRMEYRIEISEHRRVKVKEDLTPARRYSFLVGEDEPNHTAQQQITPLLTKPKLSLKEIEDAFRIESVTKEFFNKYKELFLKLKEEIDAILEEDKKIAKDFAEHEISTANFAKKLMGQIVFLYFLQKKGWLGVAENARWEEGNRKFLRTLFEEAENTGKNFFNDYLEYLFYDALNNENRGTADPSYYPRFKCRIPFLNGGLFEPMNGYDWENTELKIKNDIFKEILNTFDLYNFTVREDEPLEKEVAVDPEMLGKVFENLLEVTDRKSKGAFYTPREIVHYMCQEALIHYLHTKLNSEEIDNDNNEKTGDKDSSETLGLSSSGSSSTEVSSEKVPKKDIEEFIRRGDIYIDYALRNEAKRKEGSNITGIYKQRELPQSIIKNAVKIDALLHEIKICDPAIGSGAFPVGMMNEIVRARYALSAYGDPDPDRTPYAFKRQCIQDCIYGVDIDPGAVDIAKLRLWLSLIVDEEDFNNIQPLPNLDYKIMCGNSLIEEYEGIQLFDETILQSDDNKHIEQQINELTNRQMRIQKEYLALHSQNKLTETQHTLFDNELKEIKKQLKQLRNPKKKNNNDDTLGLFSKSEAKKKAEQLRILHKALFNETSRDGKQKLRQEIEQIEWDLIEATLKEHGKTDVLENLTKLRKLKQKPFFLWKLYFAEVFEKNKGFDIVIGNPPYVRVDDIDKFLKFQYKTNFKSAKGKYDLYYLFFEKSISLLSLKGIIAFITPNKYTAAISAQTLRTKLISLMSTIKIVSTSMLKIFEAAANYPIISIIQKESTSRELSFFQACNLNMLNGLSYHNFYFSSIVSLKTIPFYIFPINISQNTYNLLLKILYNNKNQLKNFFSISEGFRIPQKYEQKEKNDFAILKQYQFIRYSAIREGFYISKKDLFSVVSEHSMRYQRAISKKIVIAEDALCISATLDDKGRIPQGGVYFGILVDDSFSIQVILGLLNSKMMSFIYESLFAGMHMGGGYLRYRSKFLESLPIPKISESRQKVFEELVDKILKAKRENPNADTLELENKIDRLVYDLYGLTDEEIAIVENSIK